ncbi:MAG: hypothetical protein K9M10_00510 [Candidatus Pacebacteria bacterium]|nr:hypothetical protein [Candidatus Paceibacterota bacterium]
MAPNMTRVGVIYLTGNVGDMIFCTPIFRALKEAKPESEMYVIGRKRNADTLRYSPHVKEYIECPNSPYALWKILRGLKLQYAFILNPSTLELALFYLANVQAIATFSAPIASAETRTYRILKKLCIQIPFAAGENFATENLKLIAPLGIVSTDTRKHLYYSEEARIGIQNFLKEQNVVLGVNMVIALAPGAGTKIKQWPADRFAKLADHLYEKYHTPIFIVGGPGDKKEFEAMSQALNTETKVVSCLHHTIDELKAFMAQIDIVIANDSAPIYVAEAFDKATVTIVGPTDENEHPPKGVFDRVVKSKDRGVPALAASIANEQSNNSEDARSQIEKVTVLEVVDTADELIATLEKGR